MMTNVCTPRIVARPAANSFENGRCGLDRDAERAADEEHEPDDDRDRAEQAELLADGGEDEVGGGDGDDVGPAEPDAGALEAAAAERVEALHELVAVAFAGRSTG